MLIGDDKNLFIDREIAFTMLIYILVMYLFAYLQLLALAIPFFLLQPWPFTIVLQVFFCCWPVELRPLIIFTVWTLKFHARKNWRFYNGTWEFYRKGKFHADFDSHLLVCLKVNLWGFLYAPVNRIWSDHQLVNISRFNGRNRLSI